MRHPDDGNDLEALVNCPHCGAVTVIDLASIALGEEEPVVDCTTCCRPLRVLAPEGPQGPIEVRPDH